MTYCDPGSFLATASGQTMIQRGEVGVFGARRSVRGFHQSAAQPLVALVRFATLALARALLIAWTHPTPRGQVCAIGKRLEIRADFGHNHLARALIDARQLIPAIHSGLKRPN